MKKILKITIKKTKLEFESQQEITKFKKFLCEMLKCEINDCLFVIEEDEKLTVSICGKCKMLADTAGYPDKCDEHSDSYNK